MTGLRQVLLLCAAALLSTAQAQVRVMSYNMLNFPTGNLQGRTDTLENIVDYYRPHLLLIQELKTASGLSQITDMMDDLGYGNFAHGTFIPQQSNPGATNLLQQNVVYDASIFVLDEEYVVETDVRDFNGYKFHFLDEALTQPGDTTFLYVFSAHLKSSQGAAEEAARQAMAAEWVNWADAHIPTGSLVMLGGDFNLYTAEEPAYTLLTDSDNNTVMVDPLALYGDWTGSAFAHKEILTQSTRLSQLYDDGAGGGLDDRFDFILLSAAFFDPDVPVNFVEGSYHSLGNNGTCYNQSITGCADDNEVPADVIQSLYYMSDHLPQVLSFQTPASSATGLLQAPPPGLTVLYTASGVQIQPAALTDRPWKYRIFDTTGHCVEEGSCVGSLMPGRGRFSPGYYLVQTKAGCAGFVMEE